jgi:hypothetical protein
MPRVNPEKAKEVCYILGGTEGRDKIVIRSGFYIS